MINPVLSETACTPEDLLASENGHAYELVNGQLVEKHVGAEAGLVGARIIALLGAHVHGRKLGFVFTSDCGYQVFPDDPNRTRKPDMSFIGRGKLPGDNTPRGNVRVVPDLVAEVVSPNDLAEEVDARVADYLRAGVRLMWVLYPMTRAVYVFRPDGSGTRLAAPGGELSGDDVVPEFRCRLDDLFAEL